VAPLAAPAAARRSFRVGCWSFQETEGLDE